MPFHPSSQFRRTGVAALVGVLALCGTALTACGSDGDSEEKSSDEKVTTTAPASGGVETIAERFSSQTGLDVDDAAATCVAEAMVADMGDERAVEVFESNDELPELSEADQTTIRTAFNDCLPGSAVAEPVAYDFYDSIGATSAPDAETVTCLDTALDGHAGDAMWATFADEQSDPSVTVTLEAFEGCLPTSVRAELFTAALASEGLDPAQVSCVSAALAEELTLAELLEIGTSGQMTPEMQSRLTAAGASCA